MFWSQIEKPALLLHKGRALKNIEKMAAKAQRSRVRFRPHFKTHQSAQVGEWFRERGVAAITVSSADMALYFAGHGWRDMMIAFPVNLRQIGALDGLAERLDLHLLVESAAVAQRLSQKLHHSVNVWLKIDVGSHRTGLLWNDDRAVTAVALAVAEAPNLTLKGLLTHSGHTYHAGDPAEVVKLYHETVARLQAAQGILQARGWETEISIGDTPSCSLVESFEGVDEVRPGNFIFYDLDQLHIGSCIEEEIAVALACPVVAKHRQRLQIVLYGGAIHLSKEFVEGEDGRPIFGRIVLPQEGGWSPMVAEAAVVSLSQEHGVVQVDETLFAQIEVGDLLLVLPVHSCLTANLMKKYLTLDGDLIEMALI